MNYSMSNSPVSKESAQKKICWPQFLFIWGAHLAALTAFFTFSWQALLLCIVMHWVTGGVGITLGFHRLLTHRSFSVPKIVEYALSLIGSLACQGGPIQWVVQHRLHHNYSDTEGDPHTPLKGFFWAHMEWCLTEDKRGSDPDVWQKIAPDLVNDPVHYFIDRTHILWTAVLAGIFYAFGGWPYVVWGIFVRMVLVYHCTWLVNSAAHTWGYQTYKTGDRSTNLWWVALLSYGEGWHNNHHAFQQSARHGLKWWEFDPTYLLIQILQGLGVAKAVKLPTAYQLSTKSAA